MFISRFDVVERMGRRVMSAIRESPGTDWESARERVKREFADESAALYRRSECDYPDGDDLIAEAAARQAPRIRDDAVRNMEAALVLAVENSRLNMALWSAVKEDVLRANGMAIGALRESGQSSASEGGDLIGKALDNSGLRIMPRDDVLPGRIIEYLVKRRD